MAFTTSKSKKWQFGIPGFGRNQIPIQVRHHRDTCGITLHLQGVSEKVNGAEIASELVEQQLRNSSALQDFHRLSSQLQQSQKDVGDCRAELAAARERLEAAIINSAGDLEQLEGDVEAAESRLKRFSDRLKIIEANHSDAQGRVRALVLKLLQEEFDAEREALQQQAKDVEDDILNAIGEHLTRLAEIRQREAHVRLSTDQRNLICKQMLERLAD